MKKLILIFLISLPLLTFGNDSLRTKNSGSTTTKIILNRFHCSLQFEISSFNISDPTWAHNWWVVKAFSEPVDHNLNPVFPTLHMNPVSFSINYFQKYFAKFRYLNFEEFYSAQNELNGSLIQTKIGFVEERNYKIFDILFLYAPFNKNYLSPLKFGFGYSHRGGFESYNAVVIEHQYWTEIIGEEIERNDKGYIIELEYEFTPFKHSKVFKHLFLGFNANKRIYTPGYNMFSYGGTLGICF